MITAFKAALAKQPQLSAALKSKVPKAGFNQALGDLLNKDGTFHQELNNIQDKVLQGHKFSSHELLVYQIKASRFHLRVELLSKAAESVSASVRRLQQAQ